MSPELPKSPLAQSLLGRIEALSTKRTIELLSEYYDPKSFGGATSVRIMVDRMIIEVATRDPSQPFEIELRCADSDIWGRASYVRSFLMNVNDPDEQTLLPGLLNWLVENFDAVYQLICCASPDLIRSFISFSKALDEARHNRMIMAFGQARNNNE